MTDMQHANRMTDEELDVWVDIYYQASIAELLDITFSTFIKAPFSYLATSGQSSVFDCLLSGHKPLLPAQVAVAQAFESASAPQRQPFLKLVTDKAEAEKPF